MKSKSFNKFILVLLFTMMLYIVREYTGKSLANVEGEVIVNYIDVGQGDAIFIEMQDATMLIDAGESNYEDKVKEYINDLGYNKIDYVIGTHPHSDHIGGLKEVIESFEIGEIYLPKVVHTSQTYENLLNTIKEKGLKVKTGKKGVTVIDSDDINAYIISPTEEVMSNLNNYSIVLRMDFGNTSFLFTGDIESFIEKNILDEVDVDVIKVPHHGSDTSSSLDFIKSVSSKYAIISVGLDNIYNLPSNEIINRWENFGNEVYRTDKNGNIRVISNGHDITIETER